MFMKFIGQDGSLGYFKGKIYKVKIVAQENEIMLYCKGHVSCPYSSFKKLFENWQKVNN